MSRHLTIANKQQPASLQTLLNPLNTRDVERVIGTFARHNVRGQGHREGVENSLHDFDLRQIRAMVFAMAKLKEALFTHTGIGARRGAIDVHALGAQIINPYSMLIQSVFKRDPTLIVTQMAQNDFETVIGESSIVLYISVVI
jgi:hypothetical protein